MTIRIYWSGARDPRVNFGDELSPVLVERLTGQKTVYTSIKHADIVAIGSILDKVLRVAWKRPFYFQFKPIKVWGTGAFGFDTLKKSRMIDVLAVRGPMTRDRLELPTDTVLGDPGILVGTFDIPRGKKYRWGIIPHLFDQEDTRIRQMLDATPDSVMIDLSNPDLDQTVADVAACDYIFSSSLHGLITADALGIPHIWGTFGDRLLGGEWKFKDYFASMNREVNVVEATGCDLRTLEPMATCTDAALMAQRQTGIADVIKNVRF